MPAGIPGADSGQAGDVDREGSRGLAGYLDEESGVNHLHSVMDAIRGRTVLCEFHLSKDVANKLILDEFMPRAANAVCFDAGDAINLTSFKPINDLVRLPYDCCWIELFDSSSRGDIVGALCYKSVLDEDSFHVIPVTKERDGSWLFFNSMLVQRLNGEIFYHTPAESSFLYQQLCIALFCFFSAMNCSNVAISESKPSPSLAKARARRGKQPLFSTWTLEFNIPGNRVEKNSSSGTHASPRVHLRRGHIREYRQGMFTWVQPCAVGAKENGMIHKDYKAVVSKP